MSVPQAAGNQESVIKILKGLLTIPKDLKEGESHEANLWLEFRAPDQQTTHMSDSTYCRETHDFFNIAIKILGYDIDGLETAGYSEELECFYATFVAVVAEAWELDL